MIFKNKLAAILFFSIIAGLVVIPHASHALTLIPPSLEFQATPGQTYQTTVKVFNEEEKDIQVYTEVANFGPQGESGVPAFDFTQQSTDLSAWITVDKGPFAIKPGERIEIPIKVNPPKNAEPGGHYSAIFFSQNAPTDSAGTQVGIASKIGVLLLVKISGDVKEEGSIKEFSVSATKMLTRLPVDFNVRFENTGNVHLRPTGAITISNMFGHVVDTVQINQQKGATLPKSIRKYDALWERAQVKATTGNGWSKFWSEYRNERLNFGIGKYKAALSMVAGTNDGIRDTKTLSFWIVPWHVLLIYGVALVIILLALWHLIKQYNKWLINKALKSRASVPGDSDKQKEKAVVKNESGKSAGDKNQRDKGK